VIDWTASWQWQANSLVAAHGSGANISTLAILAHESDGTFTLVLEKRQINTLSVIFAWI